MFGALAFTIFILVVVITLLCWVVWEQGRSIQHQNGVHSQYVTFLQSKHYQELEGLREEYRALVQSYVIQEGKVYVTPVTRYSDKRNPDSPPDPVKHAFKMKPPPPVVVGKPSVSTAPSPNPRKGEI